MSVATTETKLLGARVRCFQPEDGYRVAVDAVLLAAAVPAQAGERVLDLGAGVAASGLCLAARVAGADVTGLEIQSELAELARKSVEASGFLGSVRTVTGDLLERPPEITAESFDHVMANPPYLQVGRGNPSPNPIKTLATCEGTAKLADWLRYAFAMAKPGGSVTIIHRADRLTELLAGMVGRSGDLAVFPLWPRQGEAAKRVIVSGRKGGGGELTILPGLALHQPGGAFTPAAEAVLRDAAGLPGLAVSAKGP